MTTEQAKAVARHHYAHFDNLEAAFAHIAPEVRVHALPGLPPTYDGWKGAHAAFMAAFPDQQLAIEDQFGEGNTVVTRWTFRGTQQGPLMGMPATGKIVTVAGISIDRVEENAVVEHWAQMDQAGLMQQLGAMPAPPTA